MFLSDRTRRPDDAGVEGAGGPGGPGHGAGGRRQGLAGQHTDTPTDWRPPRGLAELRADEPSCRSATPAPLVWRAPEGPEGLATVPVGGGRARAGLEIDHSEPSGSRVAFRAGGPPPTGTHSGPAHQGTATRAAGNQAGHSNAGDQAVPQAVPPEHGQKETPTAPGTP